MVRLPMSFAAVAIFMLLCACGVAAAAPTRHRGASALHAHAIRVEVGHVPLGAGPLVGAMPGGAPRVTAAVTNAMASAVNGTTPPGEQEALGTFFESLGGAGWTRSSGWGTVGSDPCSSDAPWFGVACETSSGGVPHVTGLELPQNNLRGVLPSLAGLPFLKALDLSNRVDGTRASNAVGGTLGALCGLTELTYLSLGQNSLTGTLPEALCDLTEMTYLSLGQNSLHGTLPTCLGTLAKLEYLYLNTNSLTGTLPEALCDLTELTFLHLGQNSLHGNLPACVGTAFPLLGAMLLHDNFLEGPLPKAWSLSALNSIMLSNNAGLEGTIPAGLFFQSLADHESPSDGGAPQLTSNPSLRAVVVEGTRLHGSIPLSLCAAPQIRTLALSGNRLTGSLPSCLTTLKALQALRAAHNHLSGDLPGSLCNLTALTTLDLGFNDIAGRVPACLGHMAAQLADVSLEQNDLSCELPASVRHWPRGPTESSLTAGPKSFHLLKGNLFGCGGRASTALAMQDAEGLRRANKSDMDAYSCGGSDYVLPVFSVGLVAAPLVMAMVLLWRKGRLRLDWRAGLSWRVEHSPLVEQIHDACGALTRLGMGVVGASVAPATLVSVLLAAKVAESPFECEYAAAFTLANKGGGGSGGSIAPLSAGVGAALGMGLVFGLAVWWRPVLTPDRPLEVDNLLGAAARALRLVSGAVYARLLGGEAVAAQQEGPAPWSSVAQGACLLLGTVLLAAGPNVAYVYVTLSDTLPHDVKIGSVVGITLVKMAVSTMAIPMTARRVARLLVPGAALSSVRFRLRIGLGTALSALTAIAAPVIIVLVTDDRCLYRAWHRPEKVTTDVAVEVCTARIAKTGRCVAYGDIVYQSTFLPAFDYDGGRCFSAALSTYAPVFLAAVLLAAVLPAALELLVVPLVAPWCHAKSASSFAARRILAALRGLSWNVLPVLAQDHARAVAASRALSSAGNSEGGVAPVDVLAAPLPPLPLINADYLAQRVVERGIMQLMGTLLVALTFGIAAPPVGGSCAVAALVQLVHHIHVLGAIVTCGIADRRSSPGGQVPDLEGCSFVPRACAAVLVSTVLFFWGGAAVGFLDPAHMAGAAAAVGLTSALLWVGCTRALRARNDTADAEKWARRGRSGASVASSAGMSLLEEPLVMSGEDEGAGVMSCQRCTFVNAASERACGQCGQTFRGGLVPVATLPLPATPSDLLQLWRRSPAPAEPVRLIML